jgi:hypothetical protein
MSERSCETIDRDDLRLPAARARDGSPPRRTLPRLGADPAPAAPVPLPVPLPEARPLGEPSLLSRARFRRGRRSRTVPKVLLAAPGSEPSRFEGECRA